MQTEADWHATQRCCEHEREASQVAGAIRLTAVLTIFADCCHAVAAAAYALAQGCFDLFGVDVMVDSQGHPWLLEVNSNPALWDTPGVLSQVQKLFVHDFARFFSDCCMAGHPGNCGRMR